jgi:hypothetical protein
MFGRHSPWGNSLSFHGKSYNILRHYILTASQLASLLSQRQLSLDAAGCRVSSDMVFSVNPVL